MAKSRKRDESERRYEVVEMDPRTFARDFAAMITDQDEQHLLAEIDSSAEGDIEAAWHHHTSVPFISESGPTMDLRELLLLGEDAPAWAWARWIPRLAHRWMLANPDPRVRDAVAEALVASHPAIDPDMDPDQIRELSNRIAANDWVCEELCVWEYGGLADYLDVKAGPRLLDRAGDVSDWPDARLGGYLLGESRRARLELTDLATGEQLRVLDLGAASDGNHEQPVIGRLVPIAADPGLMFVRRPVAVDLNLAGAIGGATTSREWLSRLAEASLEGRWGPELYAAYTPLTSDLVPEPPRREKADDEPAGRVRDLMAQGLQRPVAEAVAICEVAFIAADVAPEGIVGCAPHVALVIVHPAVFEAAMEHCTAPGREAAWRLLADNVAEPARARCLQLARACCGGEAA